MTTEKETAAKPLDFIRQIIAEDLASGKHQTIVTRFPPEPNGFLHIGHAKSICLNFGVAEEHNAVCHLRFDDTNPDKESIDYVEAIQRDVRWLGFDWGEHLYYASDYFDQLYDFAVELIRRGKAYVCHLSGEEMRAYRGTLTEPGRESPYRNRTVEENLELFERMRSGAMTEGECVLRAKIDMASPNIVLRDPVLYRILKSTHHRTGDRWCIYPMYDFTHCLSDMLEGITHSLCTLEFENNRALYDWVLDTLETPNHPRQIEFARLNINYTVTSKRKLLDPLRVVITNYPEGQVEEVVAHNHPQQPELGTRTLPFSRELYIERSDFMEDAPKKFFRLSVGREVRLRWAYLVTCHEVVKDDQGRVKELRCSYDPESRGGSAPDGRKVKGTIHWVSAPHALCTEVRLYDRLFTAEFPDADKNRDFKEFLNPDSRTVLTGCMLEPGLAGCAPEDRFQFERQGYFCVDAVDSRPGRPVFNRIVTLRDSWAKQNETT